MNFVSEDGVFFIDYSLAARRQYEELIKNSNGTVYWEGIVNPSEREAYYSVEEIFIPPQKDGALIADEYIKWKDTHKTNLFGMSVSEALSFSLFDNLKEVELPIYEQMNTGDFIIHHYQNKDNIAYSIISFKKDKDTMETFQAIRCSTEYDELVEKILKENGLK